MSKSAAACIEPRDSVDCIELSELMLGLYIPCDESGPGVTKLAIARMNRPGRPKSPRVRLNSARIKLYGGCQKLATTGVAKPGVRAKTGVGVDFSVCLHGKSILTPVLAHFLSSTRNRRTHASTDMAFVRIGGCFLGCICRRMRIRYRSRQHETCGRFRYRRGRLRQHLSQHQGLQRIDG